jgi:DNA-binding MarR family transcriptional regulator
MLAQRNISCYDIHVKTNALDGDLALLRTLAEFRCELRRFLHFSEQAASGAGLQPQQHQLLLQVAGAPDHADVTISYAAQRLSLKHNSTVELVDRSEREGLLTRTVDGLDKRRALLRVTPKGARILDQLSVIHVRELDEMAPRLFNTLRHMRASVPAALETEAQ